jgi:hypothetical protein
MSHSSNKKQRLDGHQRNDVMAAGNDDSLLLASFDDLSVDLHANIFGFLPFNGYGARDHRNIMHLRRVCKKWKEAIKKTIVPLYRTFRVESAEEYSAMNVMTTALPNLQQITLFGLGRGHKYSDGEDPDEWLAARTAHDIAHDIEIISNFTKLRELRIYSHFDLNGRYPVFFNSFPMLQILSIQHCDYLKFDLDMLAGFPLLKELVCRENRCMTGNINSLRALKDTLEKVVIEYYGHGNIGSCPIIECNFMDLADFPHLKELKLNLSGTLVTGDIRDIGENDFSSLENLVLPKGVYGGRGYEFQSIAVATDLVRTLYLLRKQRPALIFEYWYGTLSKDSPDWYEFAERVEGQDDVTPPFRIHLVEAGSRIGCQWKTVYDSSCEVNWLAPEPDREGSDYGKYIEELRQINSKVSMFRGFYQPPTEEEYMRLCKEYNNGW